MYFDSLHALLTMGGHGVYVWTAYFITTIVIVAAVFAPLRRRTSILRQLAADLKRTKTVPGASNREKD